MVRMRQNLESVVLGSDRVQVPRQIVQARNDDAFERSGSPLRSVAIEDQVLQSGRQHPASISIKADLDYRY